MYNTTINIQEITSRINKTHPYSQGEILPLFSNEEVFGGIAAELYARFIHDKLIESGMFDKDFTPSEMLLGQGFVIRDSDFFGVPPEAPNVYPESYTVVGRGYEFLLRFMTAYLANNS